MDVKNLYSIDNNVNFYYVKYEQNHVFLIDLKTKRYVIFVVYDFIYLVVLERPS